MNFLSHYYLNRYVRGVDGGPYFSMGVALPDIWPRFSRIRRIRWRSLEAVDPPSGESSALRAGMLNHVDDDRRFHGLPLFLNWQRHVRRAIAPDGGDAVTDFLAHIAVELALDRRLLDADPTLADAYYSELSLCGVAGVEARAGELADVDATGLGDVISEFLAVRFLARYVEPDGMVGAIGRVFRLTTVPTPPPRESICTAVAVATSLVDPDSLWAAMMSDAHAAWNTPNSAPIHPEPVAFGTG